MSAGEIRATVHSILEHAVAETQDGDIPDAALRAKQAPPTADPDPANNQLPLTMTVAAR